MGEHRNRNVFEYFAELIVPVVAVVSSVLTQQRVIAFILVVLAFCSFLFSYVPRFIVWWKKRRLFKKQRLISVAAIEELSGRIHAFEDFVSHSSNNALYYIVFTKLCQSNQTYADNLIPIPQRLFAGMLQFLKTRVDKQPHYASLKDYALEFNFLITCFSSYVVCPVYKNIPHRLPTQVLSIYYQQKIQNDLIQFRERFDRFLDGYVDFLRTLDQKLPILLEIGWYFERPEPVSSIETADTINGI